MMLFILKLLGIQTKVEQSDVNSFIEKELLKGSYQVKDILGEFYITATK